jgi:hypothetical protein
VVEREEGQWLVSTIEILNLHHFYLASRSIEKRAEAAARQIRVNSGEAGDEMQHDRIYSMTPK